jgi:hypothetical protein
MDHIFQICSNSKECDELSNIHVLMFEFNFLFVLNDVMKIFIEHLILRSFYFVVVVPIYNSKIQTHAIVIDNLGNNLLHLFSYFSSSHVHFYQSEN